MRLISLILMMLFATTAQAQILILSSVIDSPQVEQATKAELTKYATPAEASVQVAIDHGDRRTTKCSGTAIGEHVVLTCAHAFREPGTLTVNGKPATLIRKDDVADVAILETTDALRFAPVAARDVEPGSSVTAYGFEYHRQGLWRFPSRVLARNRFSGFANQTILGRPAQGRSGGGLFNQSGEIVGICSAGFDNEGLYCGVQAIHDLVSDKPTIRTIAQSTDATVGKDAQQIKSDCPDGRCVKQPDPFGDFVKQTHPPVVNRAHARAFSPDGECVNGQCRPPVKQPTPAPHDPAPVASRPLVSVLAAPVRVLERQPVRRFGSRVFGWRPLRGLRCR